MKLRRGIKLASVALAALFALCVLPQASLAALPEDAEVILYFPSQSPTIPTSLENGEVWVERTATADPDQKRDPITADITISALGRKYEVAKEKVRKFNIMFVLDMSNSMTTGGKDGNMATAANEAVSKLAINGNKVGVVTFGTGAATRRSLSTSPFTLTITEPTSGDLINVKPSGGDDGGTNIQAGLNVAYNELKNNLSDGAMPVIILLSDGAPTYYYNKVDTIPTPDTATKTGTGSSTSVDNIAITIAQAAYLKAMMADLSIYTISFDITSNTALATLNPNDHIDKVSNVRTTYNNIRNNTSYVSDAAIAAKMNYAYANGSYSASNSTSSLGTALTNIIKDINIFEPIAETTKTGSSELNESSYIRITDRVGEGFLLGNIVWVSYEGKDYKFTRDGDTYKLATANEQLSRIVLTYSGGQLVWKIPGKVLPCFSADGSEKPSPIKLKYTLTLDTEELMVGKYVTSSGCDVWYQPAVDNPYYMMAKPGGGAIEIKRDGPYTVGGDIYYQAVFTLADGTSGAPTLLRFGVSSNPGGPFTYLTGSELTGLTATYGSGKLTVKKGATTLITFSRPSDYNMTIAGSFYTTDRRYKNSYSIPVIAVNGAPTTDARVTDVSGKNSSRAVTTSYKLDGVDRTGLFNLSIENNRTTYGSISGYVTAGQGAQETLYTYDAAKKKLTLNLPGRDAIVLTEDLSGKDTTVFAVDGSNITVTQEKRDSAGGLLTSVVYSIQDGVLNITTTAYETQVLAQSRGINDNSYITIAVNDLIKDVTLTSLAGTENAVANIYSAGKYGATVKLTFTSKLGFNDLAFLVDAAMTLDGGGQRSISGYTVEPGTGLTESNGLFTARKAGTYSVIIRFKNPYEPDIPASYWVRFQNITYGEGKGIGHADDFVGQRVKIVMTSPTKH